MNLQNFNILIVDDDTTFGESVKAALTRAGFRAYYVANPADAISYVRLQDVHGIILDCMLPKMNGLELHKRLKSTMNGEPAVILVSGIFKDRQFINTSKNSTQAIEFLIKPFDVQDLVERLKSHFGSESEGKSHLNPLAQMYLKREDKPRVLIRTINSCEGLHNFDLLWVLALLVSIKSTGHLNIACTNGDIAGVGFLDGQIVQVNIKNEESLLGLLLCEQGFLDRQDLDLAVSEDTANTRIGQLLIQKNFVSPHSINIVLKEQILWRLRRLIADSQMELNFVGSDQVSPIVTISQIDLQNFFIDTLEHTISDDWLKTHYMPLMQNIVGIKKESEQRLAALKANPFVAKIYPALEGPLHKGTTLEELLGQYQEHEEVILKVMHFLNISDCLQFTEVQKNANLAHQIKRLSKLEAELEGKNYFERLGVSRSAKESDIKRAYFDLAKVLHPDKMSEGTPDRVQELSRKVFEKIQVAYDTLKKSDRKEAYLRELEVGQAEKLIQADQLVEKAKFQLMKGEHKKASEHLKKARALNPDSSEMAILTIWCDIKQTKNPTERFLSEVEKKLQNIPLGSRDIAAYYHTRGLYLVMLGDTEKAIKYFKTALSMDSSFINARRELSLLDSRTQSTMTNILQADLKDVVGMLFTKKK